ncbi:MAG: alanine racemase [Chloroflexia bacterium]|nr:alanine racemase [Chloroflexia bacterium]
MSDCENRVSIIQSATYARVDLGRYEDNVRILRAIAGEDKAFMAVLKANAYGHGAVACGRAATRSGANYLAVARISEGVQLRLAGIDAPILVFGGPNLAQLDRAVSQSLTISVGTEAALEAVQDAAQRSSERPIVHLKIDSGLHRYGALPDLAFDIARKLADDERIVFEGIYGHFSSADESDLSVTREQIARTERLVKQLGDADIVPRYVHLANSAGTITGQQGRSNLVRAGIATYGLKPSPDVSLPYGMVPVLSIHSRLTRSFVLPRGEGVSYGLTYRPQGNELIGTVPIGYADGLPRSLSNLGWFIVNGERSPIRGRVCMDQAVVGLSKQATVGDEVSVIGDGSEGTMSFDDVARLDGTINYEIATRLTERVPRVYYRSGEPVGWEDPILGESEGG